MTQPAISDYAHYNYQEEYWVKHDRRYENAVEHATLQKCLQKVSVSLKSLMDLGCGFGRLFGAYEAFADDFVLFDYSQELLIQARQSIQTSKKIQFIQGNAYQLPFLPDTFDAVVTIRTLHHFEDINALFEQVSRVVKLNGYFILEIPNKRHLVSIIRFLLGKNSFNPFFLEPVRLGQTFLNFHPDSIKRLLNKNGFKVIYSRNTSFFRSTFIKKWIPYFILVKMDLVFQKLFSFLNLTPSIYLVCQKSGYGSAR